jgi:glutathione S-transferase
MIETTLTISSKNYSSWSLRGWLLCRMAGLKFVEEVVPVDDPTNRAELLLLSSSILVPCLRHQGIRIWDTLAVAEYLNEVRPKAGLLPPDRAAPRSLPLDLRRNARGLQQSSIGAADEPQSPPPRLQGLVGSPGRHRPHHGDLARVLWGLPWPLSVREIDHGRCDVRSGRHAFLDLRCKARLLTYDVKLDADCAGYCDRIMALPDMVAWREAAMLEPEELEELDMEF